MSPITGKLFMTSFFVRRSTTLFVMASLVAGAGWAADSTSKADPSTKGSSSSASRPPTSSPRSGKGPLPDPTLLDGSTMPAEKKSEQGMIGDFELPGDENVRDGKVGGQQQGGQPGGRQQNQGMQVNL